MKRINKMFCKRLVLILIFILLTALLMGFSRPKEIKYINNVEKICSETVEIDTSKFYYNQLNDIEKEIYNAFSSSKNHFINNENFICISGKVSKYDEYIKFINRAFYAYMYDNPITHIYLTTAYVQAVCSQNYGKEYYDYVIMPNIITNCYTNISSDKSITTMLETLEKTTREFVNKLSGSDYEKLVQIHNWLIENASYDKTFSLPNTHNAYGAIIQKNCVCDGYAYAFKYVADMANLNTIFVTGYSISPDEKTEFHAWNYAYINEEWFLVDVTWDLGLKKNIYLLINPQNEEYLNSSHKCETKKFVYPY